MNSNKFFTDWIKKIIHLYILGLGLVFVFFVPPFQKLDEHTHFNRAVSLAEGQFFCAQDSVFTLNTGNYDLINDMFFFDLVHKYDQKFPVSLLRFTKNESVDDIKQGLGACTLHFLGYIPNSLGLSLGGIINYPLLSFYLGRLFGFLFYLVCFKFSLQLLKRSVYKNILCIYAAIPMIIHQVTSISYDVVHLSLVMPIFSLFINLLDIETKKRSFLIWLFGFVLLVFIFVKPGYYPFLMLFVLLPSKDIKKYIVRNLLFVSLFVVIFLLNQNISHLSGYTSSSLQLKLVISDPLFFLHTVVETSVKRLPWYFESIIGRFGYADYKLSYFIYYLISIVYLYTCIKISSKLKKRDLLMAWQLFFIFIIVIFVYLFVHLALYLSSNPVANSVIDRVHGRYLISLVPFITLILINLVRYVIANKRFGLLFIILFFLLIFVNIFMGIYNRFYNYSKTFSNEGELVELYGNSFTKSDKLSEILIDTDFKHVINVDVGRKIGGLWIAFTNGIENMVVPYKYLIMDENCKKIYFSSYLSNTPIRNNRIIEVVFNKKIKLKTDKVCVSIYPVLECVDTECLSVVAYDSAPLINFLYISN